MFKDYNYRTAKNQSSSAVQSSCILSFFPQTNGQISNSFGRQASAKWNTDSHQFSLYSPPPAALSLLPCPPLLLSLSLSLFSLSLFSISLCLSTSPSLHLSKLKNIQRSCRRRRIMPKAGSWESLTIPTDRGQGAGPLLPSYISY